MKNKWRTTVLGDDGGSYRFIVLSAPVLPLGIIILNLYVLSSKNLPIIVLITVMASSLVFLHQCYDIFKFIRLASKTAKWITIEEDGEITVNLFSNKKIVSKRGGYSLKQDFNRKYIPYNKKLFPHEKTHGILTISGEQYYLSGTVEGGDDMYSQIERNSD